MGLGRNGRENSVDESRHSGHRSEDGLGRLRSGDHLSSSNELGSCKSLTWISSGNCVSHKLSLELGANNLGELCLHLSGGNDHSGELSLDILANNSAESSLGLCNELGLSRLTNL